MTYALRLFGLLSLPVRDQNVGGRRSRKRLSALVAAIVICGLVSIPRGKLLSGRRKS
jgi:hypothetical protein